MNKHKEFKAQIDKWNYSWDSYSGKYLNDLENYLPKNKQRESDPEYKQRKSFVDPILMFATVVDSINGMIGEDDTDRDWGELGDPNEAGSIASQLQRNTNGAGLNWQPFFKQVGIKNTVYHTVWGLVDGKTEENGQAKVKLLPPSTVVNWYPSENPMSVIVKENRDSRDSITDDFDNDKQYYVKYTTEGWVRFVEEEDSRTEIGRGEYAYFRTQQRNQRILPIFRVKLPLPRPVGWLLAKKQNHIFNQKSSRDWGAFILSFALLKLVADSKDSFDNLIESLSGGSNVLWQEPDGNEHSYISPSGGHLGEATTIIQNDLEQFYEAAFKQYGDAAKQLTATQIMQESRTGIEAFLKLLVDSIDQFENEALFRLEQVYFPDNPSAWGEASVKRSRNFAPEDVDEAIKNKLSWIYPKGKLPMTVNGMFQMTMDIYDQLNIDTSEIDEGQLKTVIQQILNKNTQENDLFQATGLQ